MQKNCVFCFCFWLFEAVFLLQLRLTLLPWNNFFASNAFASASMKQLNCFNCVWLCFWIMEAEARSKTQFFLLSYVWSQPINLFQLDDQLIDLELDESINILMTDDFNRNIDDIDIQFLDDPIPLSFNPDTGNIETTIQPNETIQLDNLNSEIINGTLQSDTAQNQIANIKNNKVN